MGWVQTALLGSPVAAVLFGLYQVFAVSKPAALPPPPAAPAPTATASAAPAQRATSPRPTGYCVGRFLSPIKSVVGDVAGGASEEPPSSDLSLTTIDGGV